MRIVTTAVSISRGSVARRPSRWEPVVLTSTTSDPVSQRAKSKSWTDEWSSIGAASVTGHSSAVLSAPRGSNAVRRRSSIRPVEPSATRRRASANATSWRRWNPISTCAPARSTSSTRAAELARSSVSGFSHSAGTLAATAASTLAAWTDDGLAMITASALSNASSKEATRAPTSAATAVARAASGSTSRISVTAGRRPSNHACMPPMLPAPMTATRIRLRLPPAPRAAPASRSQMPRPGAATTSPARP